jgi:hypothetical protein
MSFLKLKGNLLCILEAEMFPWTPAEAIFRWTATEAIFRVQRDGIELDIDRLRPPVL